MNILDKIRKLPEKKRKIILWTIMSGVFLSFLVFYFFNLKDVINKYKEEKDFIDLSPFQTVQEDANKTIDKIFNNINSKNN